MRALLLLSLLLCGHASAQFTIGDPFYVAAFLHAEEDAPAEGFTLVTSGYKASANNTDVTTDAVDTTGAGIITVSAVWFSSGGTGTLTDSKGNNWTNVVHSEAGSPNTCIIFRSQNSPTVGSGHTFTLSGGASLIYPAIAFAAFTGTAVSVDATNGFGANVSSIQPGSVTPSQDDCLIVTSIGFYNNNGMSINSGFSTPIESARVASAVGNALSYLIQGTAGAVNPTWSWAGGDNQASTAIAVFRE